MLLDNWYEQAYGQGVRNSSRETGMDDTGIDRIAAAIERLATMVTILTFAVSGGVIGIVLALNALR